MSWRPLGGEDLWGWLLTRACWAVDEECVAESLHGVGGDAQVWRLRERALRAGVVPGSLEDVPEAVAGGARPVTAGGWDPLAWGPVGAGDLGPVLGGVVECLVGAGAPGGVAAAGTARVAEIAAGVRAKLRHERARADARDGVLEDLGVGEDAAGAWMSLVAGSRRGGPESSLVMALRGGGGPQARHGVWLARVVAGLAPAGGGACRAA